MITNTRTHVCLLLSFAFRFLALVEWCLTQQTMLWPDGVSSRYHHACYNYASNNPLICTYIIVIIMGVQVRIDVHGARLIARVDEHQEEVYLKGLNHDTNYGVATNLPSVVLVGGECTAFYYSIYRLCVPGCNYSVFLSLLQCKQMVFACIYCIHSLARRFCIIFFLFFTTTGYDYCTYYILLAICQPPSGWLVSTEYIEYIFFISAHTFYMILCVLFCCLWFWFFHPGQVWAPRKSCTASNI